MSATSKTRQELIALLTPKVTSFECEGVTIYCIPMTESKRCVRFTQFISDDGKVSDDYIDNQRAITIIDHVCDAEGHLLFTDKDLDLINGMDNRLLEKWYYAIESLFVEKKERAASKDTEDTSEKTTD